MNHYELVRHKITPYFVQQTINNILILYNKEMTTLLRYPEGKADGNCRVPSIVTAIGEYAFRNHRIWGQFKQLVEESGL